MVRAAVTEGGPPVPTAATVIADLQEGHADTARAYQYLYEHDRDFLTQISTAVQGYLANGSFLALAYYVAMARTSLAGYDAAMADLGAERYTAAAEHLRIRAGDHGKLLAARHTFLEALKLHLATIKRAPLGEE